MSSSKSKCKHETCTSAFSPLITMTMPAATSDMATVAAFFDFFGILRAESRVQCTKQESNKLRLWNRIQWQAWQFSKHSKGWKWHVTKTHISNKRVLKRITSGTWQQANCWMRHHTNDTNTCGPRTKPRSNEGQGTDKCIPPSGWGARKS